MSAQAPTPPDFTQTAVNQNTAATLNNRNNNQANRPNQTTPFGSMRWTQDANGNWTQTASLSPQLQALMGRAPMDWSQFGTIGTGDDARNQATEAAYRAQMQRLQPEMQDTEERMTQRLANQGVSEDSAAGQAARSRQDRANAYATGQARSSAISEGNRAGNDVFRNNMMSRQQAIAEALRARGMPVDELQALMGFLQMPGFNSNRADPTPDLLGAAGLQSDADYRAWVAQQQADADLWRNIGGTATSLLGLAF